MEELKQNLFAAIQHRRGVTIHCIIIFMILIGDTLLGAYGVISLGVAVCLLAFFFVRFCVQLKEHYDVTMYIHMVQQKIGGHNHE